MNIKISTLKAFACFIAVFCLLSCEKADNELEDFMFYIENDLGCGNIDVTVDGVTKTIYSPAGKDPSCNHTGSATFRLRPGTYEMFASCREGSAYWEGPFEVKAGMCGKRHLFILGNTGPGPGSGNNNGVGSVIFWTGSDHGCGPISVTVNGQTRTISKYSTSGMPSSCNVDGFATFNLNPGTYSFTASCGRFTWQGTIPVTSNQCFRYELYGSNGNSGTSPPTETKMVFWTKATKYGRIDIYVNEVFRGTITNSYTGAPNCGAQGCVTVTISGQNNTWRATSATHNWSSQKMTLTSACTSMELY